jgi:hypothetical protein
VFLSPGGSPEAGVRVPESTTGSNLALEFEDNERNNATTGLTSLLPGAAIRSRKTVTAFTLQAAAASTIIAGTHVAPVMVDDHPISGCAHPTIDVR